MTTQHKKALALWEKDQSQELPASLENVFIEDCLEKLKNSLKVRNNLNKLTAKYCMTFNQNNIDTVEFFSKQSKPYKVLSVLSFLSRTPNGEAVMPFLDVETKEYLECEKMIEERFKLSGVVGGECRTCGSYLDINPYERTLDHLLYREFTEALRIGKSVKEALKIINLIYCKNA